MGPVIKPAIACRKGFDNFAVQGTLRGSPPTGNESVIGETLLWNNTFLYKIFKNSWPEMAVMLLAITVVTARLSRPATPVKHRYISPRAPCPVDFA